ncbi:MAG: alpha/beta hydrolase [Blastomonas fulva]|uniref:alpha/beta hydrolase n=1 Tax=Blastomonas fulva TaxID=1550728 RepID=UPI0024E1A41B|nr:alpha/beta hydrolase [Blastomonas fulva]MDK2755155.1 alpha/beta hydrolase [Blastomonas fulva]
MRWKTFALMVTAGLIAPALIVPTLAQQRGGRERLLDRECRREIVKLCGLNRSEMRSCLRERGDELSERCKTQFVEGIAKRRPTARTSQPSDIPLRAIAYGTAAQQTLDLYLPQAERPASGYPLVVYLHGGGWRNGDRSMVQQKPDLFVGKGWAFASVGYRLLPEAPVEQQAEDVASALRKLLTQSQALGIDPARVIVMGHSAGAHLAALVSTDPAYLKSDMDRIAGVILLDGAGYDVARQMRDTPMIAKSLYVPAFGTDPARQARLSPITHAAAPNVSRWLILHVASRQDATEQSNALAAALRAAGSKAVVQSIAGENHMTINRQLGAGDNAHTRAVTAFLEEF